MGKKFGKLKMQTVAYTLKDYGFKCKENQITIQICRTCL